MVDRCRAQFAAIGIRSWTSFMICDKYIYYIVDNFFIVNVTCRDLQCNVTFLEWPYTSACLTLYHFPSIFTSPRPVAATFTLISLPSLCDTVRLVRLWRARVCVCVSDRSRTLVEREGQCVCMCIYIYIYIRERERERVSENVNYEKGGRSGLILHLHSRESNLVSTSLGEPRGPSGLPEVTVGIRPCAKVDVCRGVFSTDLLIYSSWKQIVTRNCAPLQQL